MTPTVEMDIDDLVAMVATEMLREMNDALLRPTAATLTIHAETLQEKSPMTTTPETISTSMRSNWLLNNGNPLS